MTLDLLGSGLVHFPDLLQALSCSYLPLCGMYATWRWKTASHGVLTRGRIFYMQLIPASALGLHEKMIRTLLR